MATFKEYPIYKKRDGQSFKQIGSIYACGFVQAKKKFAKNCANDLYKEIWLTYLRKDEIDNKKFEVGFYINHGLVWNDDGTVNTEDSEMECFLSQRDIDKGFTTFREDVYTWELRRK